MKTPNQAMQRTAGRGTGSAKIVLQIIFRDRYPVGRHHTGESF
jgi:hypothetical protein